MSDTETRELFPVPDYRPPANVVEYRKTGIIPYQGLRAMIDAGDVACLDGIQPDQLQPASLDLRLGRRAYRVRASFLPGPNATVMDKVKQLDGLPAIDLAEGAVLERGAVYLVELMESVRLTGGVEGVANPKSSTGRLDVLTRLITDRGTAFDRIERGYKGPLYAEVAPLTFSVVVRQGSRLDQARFQRGSPSLPMTEVERLYAAGELVRAEDGELQPLRSSLVPVTVDLEGGGPGTVIGYRAKKNTNKIDVDLVRHYDPRAFWERLEHDEGRLALDKDEFYILGTREEVGVPPHLAAEMMPYDPSSGEFRVHYAGFFDPGFGWSDGARGSRAVLEVRSHGVSFTLEHGQTVGWLNYCWIATGRPEKVYGEGIRSNYQGQGVALAKHFRPFPG